MRYARLFRLIIGLDHLDQTLGSTVAHHRTSISQFLDLEAGYRSHARLHRRTSGSFRFVLIGQTGRQWFSWLFHLNHRRFGRVLFLTRGSWWLFFCTIGFGRIVLRWFFGGRRMLSAWIGGVGHAADARFADGRVEQVVLGADHLLDELVHRLGDRTFNQRI